MKEENVRINYKNFEILPAATCQPESQSSKLLFLLANMALNEMLPLRTGKSAQYSCT